jgi:uncharacterized protein (TIGR02246 family)
MDTEYIYQIISQGVKACVDQDAAKFASLFTESAEIILTKDQRITKFDLERVTGDYFANLEYIKIDVLSVIIQDNRAYVEWVWEDFNRVKQQKNYHENLIRITFAEGLIQSWREYRG